MKQTPSIRGSQPKRQIIDIPGHTPGSIAVLDQKNLILVSGDTVQDGNIFMFGERRDIGQYIESLKHLKEYDGLYDEIYPMHGSFPVQPDLIDKLIDGATDILEGRTAASPADLFGQQVSYYRFEYAGFLCDPTDRQDIR